MTKAPLPIGKDFQVVINKRYTPDLKLYHGIYDIIVEKTPRNLKCCLLAVKEFGKNVFPLLFN